MARGFCARASTGSASAAPTRMSLSKSVPGAEHHFLVKPLSSGRPHRIAPEEMISGALEGERRLCHFMPRGRRAPARTLKPSGSRRWSGVRWTIGYQAASPKVIWTIDGGRRLSAEAEPTCVRGRVGGPSGHRRPVGSRPPRPLHRAYRAAGAVPSHHPGAFSFAAVTASPAGRGGRRSRCRRAQSGSGATWQVDVVDLEPGVPVEVALRSPVRGISSFRDGRGPHKLRNSHTPPRPRTAQSQPTCGVWVLFGGATGIDVRRSQKALAGPGQDAFPCRPYAAF